MLTAMLPVMIAALTGCGTKGTESMTDTAGNAAISEVTDDSAGLADGEAAEKGNTEYIIRLGHSDTEDNLLNISLTHYADWVKEQTDGRVLVRLYPDEELGDNTEMAQQLVTGELDAMMMPQGVEAVYAPKIATLGLPFLFNSYEQAWAVMDDPEVAEGLTEGLEDYNLVQLAFWENGMRQITNNAREVNTPEDMAGLRMRIPDDSMTASIMKALGANPTTFSWSRTYEALKQGTFDGQENPIANIYASSIQDVNKYMTITNHKYESKNLVFSSGAWNRLPEDIQEILREGAKTFGQEHRKAVAAAQDQQLKELKDAGMIVNETPEIDAFKEATRSVYTNFELQNEWTVDLVARIREITAQKGE